MHDDVAHRAMYSDLIPDLRQLSLLEYLNLQYPESNPLIPNERVITWDSYIAVLFECCPDLIESCLFATHSSDYEQRHRNLKRVRNISDLNGAVRSQLAAGQHIVNVDLDYFVDGHGKPLPPEYLVRLFKTLSESSMRATIRVLTISLSPECCGSWEIAERLCTYACQSLGVEFSLPMRSIM